MNTRTCTALVITCFLPAAIFASQIELKLVDARGADVADAVVSLRPADGRPVPAPAPAEGVEVRQEKQEFVPYVTAVAVGTRVGLPNADNVEHHVYSQSRPKPFNFPLHKPGMANTVAFDQPGVVTIGCNIHDWMIAYVVVLDTPWFAKSSADGIVRATDVPAGRYTATIWHPQLAAPVTREITVGEAPAAAPERVTLTLRPDRRIRRPADSAGGGYR